MTDLERTGVGASSGRVPCAHCGSRYAPALVKHRCPVCRTPAQGVVQLRHAALDSDDRMLLIVALATVTNIVVLAVLAAYLLS